MHRMIERLENRQLLDAAGATAPSAPPATPDTVPPTLETVRVVGPWKAARGVALTFSEPLDPAAATNVSFFRVWGVYGAHQRKLPLGRAEYDDATRTVTLVPARPTFNVRRSLRTVLVRTDVTDTAGNRLAGDTDGFGYADYPEGHVVYLFRPPRTKRVFTYLDSNRSRVSLRLKGPGRATLVTRAEGAIFEGPMWEEDRYWGEGLQLYIDGATPQTVLTGTVTTGRNGADAATTLLEIINPGGAQLPLLTDPAFSVASVHE